MDKYDLLRRGFNDFTKFGLKTNPAGFTVQEYGNPVIGKWICDNCSSYVVITPREAWLMNLPKPFNGKLIVDDWTFNYDEAM
jgi:hypothetical protein